jgi:hypothetical protein
MKDARRARVRCASVSMSALAGEKTALSLYFGAKHHSTPSIPTLHEAREHEG